MELYFGYCELVKQTDDTGYRMIQLTYPLICVFLSVLLGCSCCSTVDETLENVARGMARRIKEKNLREAGRVGDIDFIGSTKTRGKVNV